MFSRGLAILEALTSRTMREHVARTIEGYKALPVTECPCCGHIGKFDSFGLSARMGANCPRCESKERHRLFALAIQRGFLSFKGTSVLHFAPEPVVRGLVEKDGAAVITTADITPGRADITLDIENIALAPETFDRVICSHVLEHVDDAKALLELKRILKPGGYAVIMIPIVEGWPDSYEDRAITSEAERELHFGQDDHIRFYGADFRDRVRASGLDLSEFTASGPDSPKYGLQRGEKVFKAERRAD